jgi:hypothetical protein
VPPRSASTCTSDARWQTVGGLLRPGTEMPQNNGANPNFALSPTAGSAAPGTRRSVSGSGAGRRSARSADRRFRRDPNAEAAQRAQVSGRRREPVWRQGFTMALHDQRIGLRQDAERRVTSDRRTVRRRDPGTRTQTSGKSEQVQVEGCIIRRGSALPHVPQHPLGHIIEACHCDAVRGP